MLDQAFESQPLSHWRERLADIEGVWAPAQTSFEVAEDPQVVANGYIPQVDAGDGSTFPVVANPVQYDEQPAQPTPAPDHGQHTEEVLLELGLDWDRIAALKEASAIL